MPDRSQSVASLVLDHSECAEVFQKHRIDFCCKGHLSIADAAASRGVDVDALLGELDRAIAARGGLRDADPRELTTPRLVAHIVSRHHEYLRRAIPFVRGLASKVGRVHGDHNPKLRDLDVAVSALGDALLTHLDEEENVLFPLLTGGDASPARTAAPLAAMQSEHLEVAALLDRIHAASDDFTLPDWACNSYRTLFAELRALERDILTHVHLENHVLAPRFGGVAPQGAQA
ncbi:MAG: iron-sulfur cluster repair di-iron protein [Sandaracinaceae bacterium]